MLIINNIMDVEWIMGLVVKKYQEDNATDQKIVKYDLSDIMRENLNGENFQDSYRENKRKRLCEILRKREQRLKTWKCYKKKKGSKDCKYLCDICKISKYDVIGRFENHQKICIIETSLINEFRSKNI